MLEESVLSGWLGATLTRADDRELFNPPVGVDDRQTQGVSGR
jgi:hypothetical protein